MRAVALVVLLIALGLIVFLTISYYRTNDDGSLRRTPKPKPAKLTRHEKRRKRAMEKRGDGEFFLTDAQLRVRANVAWTEYLRGDDDGGLPPFGPTEDQYINLNELGGLYISPRYDHQKNYRGPLNPDINEE